MRRILSLAVFGAALWAAPQVNGQPDKAPPPRSGPNNSKRDTSEIDRLRAQVKELEAKLAAREPEGRSARPDSRDDSRRPGSPPAARRDDRGPGGPPPGGRGPTPPTAGRDDSRRPTPPTADRDERPRGEPGVRSRDDRGPGGPPAARGPGGRPRGGPDFARRDDRGPGGPRGGDRGPGGPRAARDDRGPGPRGDDRWSRGPQGGPPRSAAGRGSSSSLEARIDRLIRELEDLRREVERSRR